MTKNQALALLMEMHWNCKHYKGGYDDPKRDQKAEALSMAMTALKHWDIYDKMHDELECQEKFTDWDDRKKLLQPERSDFDWSIVDAMVNGLLDNGALPDSIDPHGGGWLQDWLKNFMWEHDINPADLLMEEKNNG